MSIVRALVIGASIATVVAACDSAGTGLQSPDDGGVDAMSADGTTGMETSGSGDGMPDIDTGQPQESGDGTTNSDADMGDSATADGDDAVSDVALEPAPVAIPCDDTNTCPGAKLGTINGDVFEGPNSQAFASSDADEWVSVTVQPYMGGNLITNSQMSVAVELISAPHTMFALDAYLSASYGTYNCSQVTASSSKGVSFSITHLTWPKVPGTLPTRSVSIHVYAVATAADGGEADGSADASDVDAGTALTCWSGENWQLTLDGGD